MLQKVFYNVYTKYKLHFYQSVFEKWQNREASLTTVETFCMEIIFALGRPTVKEFAELANLSSSNAAYKVNHLVKKGYLRKIQSETDRREFYLEPTQRYQEYYNLSYDYLDTVIKRVEKRFSPEELEVMARILRVMDEELMFEIVLPEKDKIK